MTINGKVYKLLKAMYGLRDAGASFDRKVLDVMNLMGVSLGQHLLQDDSFVGIQCGDGRCAGSNPLEQNAEIVPSRCRGR